MPEPQTLLRHARRLQTMVVEINEQLDDIRHRYMEEFWPERYPPMPFYLRRPVTASIVTAYCDDLIRAAWFSDVYVQTGLPVTPTEVTYLGIGNNLQHLQRAERQLGREPCCLKCALDLTEALRDYIACLVVMLHHCALRAARGD